MKTWSPELCGKYAMVAECEYGHRFAKKLYCGREWCSVCGAHWSDWHKQKFARWLPKLQRLSIAGYLVVTIPMACRDSLRSKAELRQFRRGVVRALKRMGYSRGLSRWHYFGDKHPGLWYPHLNILLDRGRLNPNELKAVKAMLAKHLRVDMVVVHYHYTSSIKKILHWGRYITRATFTNCLWDEAMADELYRFNNCHSWGDWDSLPIQWYLPPSVKGMRELVALELEVCPICGKNLRWIEGGLNKVEALYNLGFVDYIVGWLYQGIPPP